MGGWKNVTANNKIFVAAPVVAPTLDEIHREAYAAFGRSVPRPALPSLVADLGAGVIDAAAPIFGRYPRFRNMLRTLTSAAEFDGAAFASATGFMPEISLARGLRETADWIRESGA